MLSQGNVPKDQSFKKNIQSKVVYFLTKVPKPSCVQQNWKSYTRKGNITNILSISCVADSSWVTTTEWGGWDVIASSDFKRENDRIDSSVKDCEQ